ncbi:MAG: HAD family hydrolase [Clostridia bacterium]|nr:HAD family hydrolase [Clostridia bacterium]
MKTPIAELTEKKAFICDMDGVIYRGNQLIPHVHEFVSWLNNSGKNYLFLTNGSSRSPRELSQKLARLGLEVDESHFYTSALATAAFLKSQCPGGSAYVIGEPGLVNALYDAGFTMNDANPDYVVFGMSTRIDYNMIEKAVRLIERGAKLIGANPDLTDPSEQGIVPACRAMLAPIELTTGKQAYFVGKPNPLMMRHAKQVLNCHRSETVIIGDRMDTDIIAGIESEIDTVLVLSGVSTRETVDSFPYRPKHILRDVGEIIGL